MGMIAITVIAVIVNYLWNLYTDFFFSKKKRMAMYEKAQRKEMGKIHRELKSTTEREMSKWSENTKV